MRPESIGTLVSGAIPIFSGIYITLLAFRVIGKRLGPDPKHDAWHNRFGGVMRVVGPLLILFGLFQWVAESVKVLNSSSLPMATNWKRYATADGVSSAEFPYPPTAETKSAFGIEMNSLRLSLPDSDLSYRLTSSDITAGAPPATDEERLDSMKDNVIAFGTQISQKYEFLREEKISENGMSGRYLEFAAGEKHFVRLKVFVLDRRIYRIIAVMPQSKKEDEATRHFLSSFRIEKSKM